MFFHFGEALNVILSPVLIAWVLMAISLFAQCRHRFRFAIVTNSAALAILWFTGTATISNALVRSLEMQNIPKEIPQADAIVVLAGVTQRPFPPQPVVHLERGADRLVYAAMLYKTGKAPLVIFSGNRTESAEMAEVMAMMAVPRAAMVEENTSFTDTYGAARDLKHTFDSHNVHTILIVTSAIRMPRALAVFRHLGIRAIPAPTDFATSAGSHRHDILAAILPNISSLDGSAAAFHELFGLLGYRLASWI
jgi:uncharacterized SAM-binding protein YcdF (DUF218 family)